MDVSLKPDILSNALTVNSQVFVTDGRAIKAQLSEGRAQSNSLLGLALFAIAARIIFDLFGESATTLAPGGAFAIFVAAFSILACVINPTLRRALMHPASWMILISLLLYVIVSLAAEIDVGISIRLATHLKIISGIIPFLMLALGGFGSADRQQFKKFYIAFLLCLSVPSVIAILQALHVVRFTYFDAYAGHWVGRPSGGYRQPNSLARLYVIAVLLTYFAVDIKLIKNGGNKFIILALLLAGITLTTHRSSLFIAASIIMMLESRSGANFFRFTLVGIVGLLFTVSQPAVLSAISNNQQLKIITSVFRNDGISLRGRDVLIERALDTFSQSGWTGRLFGIGYEPFIIDNGNLFLLISQGLVGGALFAIGVGWIFFLNIKRVEKKFRIFAALSVWVLFCYQFILYAHTASHLMWMLGAVLYFSSMRTEQDRTAANQPLR